MISQICISWMRESDSSLCGTPSGRGISRLMVHRWKYEKVRIGHVTYVYVDVDLSAWRWWTCRNIEYSIRSMSSTQPPALSSDDLCVTVKVCMRGYMCEWRACVEGDEVLRRKCLWIPELVALERDQSLATDIHSSIDRLPLKVNILCY